jgi:outer membrane biosynthesis protein TonB
MNTNSTQNDRQKSLLLSILLFASMLIMLFFIRFWPPSDVAEFAGGGGGGGVSINFGDTEMGMDETFDNKTIAIKEEIQSQTAPENPDENVISEVDSKDEGVVIPKKETVIKPKVVPQKPEKVTVVQKPKLNETTNSTLSNIIKGAKKNGDGNTKKQGNQGSANGSLTNGGYGIDGNGKGTGGGEGNGKGKGSGDGSGNGSGGGAGNGKGTGSGYSLNGRKAMSKPKPDSSCSNETGVVVVEVTVDKNGTTIHAVVGKRGSTITAKCLKDQAKQAAINTKWAPSPDGTEEQVGEIIYTFGLN